ncbi:MAG: site-specific integrase [Pseudoflavonifractor sp.]|nr:site-specific integrase [Pseudoflavonifractor sp.]
MITTRFYLDCRGSAPGSPASLKLVLTLKGVRALLPTNLSVLSSQWDARRQIVVGHPRKQQLNSLLAEQKLAVDSILFRLSSAGELRGLRACDIKNRVLAELYPESAEEDHRVTFLSRFNSFVARRSPGTQRIYGATLARMRAYLNGGLDALTFDDITVQWLRGFDEFLAKTSPLRNARNIHFRNIRAVFNDALDDEVISCYPFRKFKIIPERTRKRALTVGQLRNLFSASVEPHEQRYLDCFKLIFMLCGINVVDLCGLDSVIDGRVEYSRAKTHRLYSIRVEPECAEIIARYRGNECLLNFCDNCSGYRSFYSRLCLNLHAIASRLGLPPLSSYWARHSWATIAASLDIPKETIAAALGHGGNSVTDIYIDFDRSKVDAANRKVLDWVLYGKK